MKAVLRGKIITLSGSQGFGKLRTSKQSRWEERNKIKAKINEIKMKKSIQRINEIKNWFFGKISKIDNIYLSLPKEREC